MVQRVEVNKDLLSANRERALANRELFLKHGVRVINMMSSPGAGKTTLLERTAERYRGKMELAVLVGDITTQRDAERLRSIDDHIQAEQIVTEQYGSACHLDARMIGEALSRVRLEGVKLLFIENVGNLVCPAGAYLGEDRRVVLLSVPEGDDKVKKYPVMFRDADLVIVSKMDLKDVCGFDDGKVESEAREIKGGVDVLRLSARSGAGMEQWYRWVNALVAQR